MRRHQRLKRKRRLRADPETTRAWERRSRKPLPRWSSKRLRGRQILEEFHRIVMARSFGRCEACLVHRLDGCHGRAEQAHHVVPRSRGAGWPWLHDPEVNGLAVSVAHHDWIHNGDPSRATDLDLLRQRPPTDELPGLPAPLLR